MRQRIITGLIFTLTVLLFIVPGYFYSIFIAVFLGVVLFMSLIEMKRSFASKNIELSFPFLFLGGIIAFIPILFFTPGRSALQVFAVYALLAMIYALCVTIIIPVLDAEAYAFRNGVATAAVSTYMSFPIACGIIMVIYLPHGWIYFVVGLFAPWVSDVFAYFTGVLIGKHKIIPHISPKKTVEGCIGGALGCMIIVAIVLVIFVYPHTDFIGPFWIYVILSAFMGIALSIFSQLGDWFASALKRWMNIKDFGTLLPGHGGVMDRFDSAFFTLPVTLIFALLMIWW